MKKWIFGTVAVVGFGWFLTGQKPQPMQITTATLPQGEIALAYSATLQATGGHTPYTWAVTSGSLPSGLALSATGVISGTPQAQGTTFTVQVSDNTHLTAQKQFTMSIAPKLVFVTDSCPSGKVGVPYACQIVGAGGVAPYKCIADKPLPPGLTLDSTKCIVSGIPTQSGSFTF